LVLLYPENISELLLGGDVGDRVRLLYAGMCDMVRHEKHKLEIREAMVHIMAPATKQTKFAAYEALDLAVANLMKIQYDELTQEQHPVNEWNRIILAIKADRFDNDLEYEEFKHRASKKSVFIQSFTPRNKVKFAMEGSTTGVQEAKLDDLADIQSLLKSRRPVAECVSYRTHALTGKEWEAMCTHIQMLNTILPELQEIISNSEEAIMERLMGVEDELGVELADLGAGDGVPGGGICQCLERLWIRLGK
jgi:hypothetical protein